MDPEMHEIIEREKGRQWKVRLALTRRGSQGCQWVVTLPGGVGLVTWTVLATCVTWAVPSCHHVVSFIIRPTRVVTPRGCRLSYVDHTPSSIEGYHHLNRVLTTAQTYRQRKVPALSQGPGADPVGELHLGVRHGSRRLRHDQQVFRGGGLDRTGPMGVLHCSTNLSTCRSHSVLIKSCRATALRH
jgi:hypothetical protein